VTGAVGSVTGNVGGNVTGSVASVVAAVSVSAIQASALADLFDTNSGTTYSAAVAGSVVKEIADNAGGSSLTEEGIADAVWNEAQSGHTSAGTFGLYLDGKVSEAGGSALTEDGIAGAVWADTLAEDYPTFGDTTPTAKQMMWLIMQGLLEREIDSTSLTPLKIDGSVAGTYTITLNSDGYPTKVVRAS
jgi:hypothetical protein